MKMIARLLAIAVLAGALTAGVLFALDEADNDASSQFIDSLGAAVARETLRIWYTDDDLTEYIQSASVAFMEKEENQHLRIDATLVSALEYLENIGAASLTGDGPDLYIIGHDKLEKAYLAGLARPVASGYAESMAFAYPQTGLSAVTYRERFLAYPLYFETSALLYNHSHLEEMVRLKIVAEADEAAANQAMLDLETYGPEEEARGGAAHLADIERLLRDDDYISGRIEELKPASFEDLKDFANNYDAPEGAEGLLKWDVTDIFYNYFFVGDAITVGGDAGDDLEQIDIYNENAIRSLRMYQDLNQFFAIDTSQVSYDEVIEEFIAGKIVYTIATTDALERLLEAQETGAFPYEFGVVGTPDIDAKTPTRPLSMTACVAVNGYSLFGDDADRFAVFLSDEYSGHLFPRTGKVPAARGTGERDEHLAVFAAEYARSIPLPKMIETANFWIWLEVTFARIWEGADANDQLRALAEQIMSQVTGEHASMAYIEVEDENAVEMEYLDEEELIREALQGEGGE